MTGATPSISLGMLEPSRATPLTLRSERICRARARASRRGVRSRDHLQPDRDDAAVARRDLRVLTVAQPRANTRDGGLAGLVEVPEETHAGPHSAARLPTGTLPTKAAAKPTTAAIPRGSRSTCCRR